MHFLPSTPMSNLIDRWSNWWMRRSCTNQILERRRRRCSEALRFTCKWMRSACQRAIREPSIDVYRCVASRVWEGSTILKHMGFLHRVGASQSDKPLSLLTLHSLTYLSMQYASTIILWVLIQKRHDIIGVQNGAMLLMSGHHLRCVADMSYQYDIVPKIGWHDIRQTQLSGPRHRQQAVMMGWK